MVLIYRGGTVSGSSISGGTLHGSAITGSTIDISANGGYLQMGAGSNWTKHPAVSGLNVSGNGDGIAMNGAGISGFGGASNNNAYTLSSGSYIELTGAQLRLKGGTETSSILLWSNGAYQSMNNIYIAKQGNGAQLGELWVGDHVINDSLGSQISMDYNLDLYAKSGYNVRAGGEIVATRNWCNSNFEPKSSNISIKTQIQERSLKDIPDILRQIKLYDYKYIDDFYDGKSDYGYIIDYLEKIPNLNKYIDFIKDEYEDVNDKRNKYSTSHIHTEHLIKFLLGSIVELQHQIDEIRR